MLNNVNKKIIKLNFFFKKTKIKTAIKELDITKIYAAMQQNVHKIKYRQKNYANTFSIYPLAEIDAKLLKKKRGYAKRMVRLRYRWYYKSELTQFKSFKKFFKRGLKRYRKIQKNRLFVTKFKKNFSKLTGFNEKFIYKKWLLFHQNYNQYWWNSNAVLKFSQSLIMAPYAFLVALKIAPSLLASRYLINLGSISINGNTVTIFENFAPGDILQINPLAITNMHQLFSYQKWQNFTNIKHTFPFLLSDWSSLMFYMIKWPKSHELIAPSFLSERWIRYYIRLFPVKASKFKILKHNTHIYKKIIAKI